MVENCSTSETNEVVMKAIASLATRVTVLEKEAPAESLSTGESDFRPALASALNDLKALRAALLTSSSEVNDKLKELEHVKEENDKLKYRIKHLLRALDDE